MGKARIRDRLVHVAAHPLVFTALGIGRHTGLPGRRIVASAEGVREVLTKVPLDRTDRHTTGGLVRGQGSAGESWFDGHGSAHRQSRRELGAALTGAGIRGLARHWQPVLDQYAQAMTAEAVDVVTMSRIMSGLVTLDLLGMTADRERALALTAATRIVAAISVRAHLAGDTSRNLTAPLVREFPGLGPSEVMLAVAATTTMLSAIPRALAWCADDDLFPDAQRDPEVMAAELMRVIAPTPLLPRIVGDDSQVEGRPVRRGDQLLLYLLPAIARPEPSVQHPQPPAQAQLAFGAGSHACPGRGLALAMVADALRTFAPIRPRVTRAVPDVGAGLPQWRSLWLR